jgi:hypothetical protein
MLCIATLAGCVQTGAKPQDSEILRLAKDGYGKYRPATLDGKPIADCAYFGITWSAH